VAITRRARRQKRDRKSLSRLTDAIYRSPDAIELHREIVGTTEPSRPTFSRSISRSRERLLVAADGNDAAAS